MVAATDRNAATDYFRRTFYAPPSQRNNIIIIIMHWSVIACVTHQRVRRPWSATNDQLSCRARVLWFGARRKTREEENIDANIVEVKAMVNGGGAAILRN